jgi:legumain
MFLKLPKNTGIYALSAANPTESSWATYCSPNDVINGKSIGSCLGDEFSVNWMEDSEAADVNSETLLDQWKAVSTRTTLSDVM